MNFCKLVVGSSLWLLAAPAPVWAADAAAGRAVFRQQCSICHSAEPNDNGGAQGPALNGTFGKRAGSTSNFAYTGPLRNSGLIWDAQTLAKFLAAPSSVVPGTSMVIPVTEQSDRDNLVAYLESVKDVANVARVTTPTVDSVDWRKDRPGRVHRIEVAKLPAPFHTTSVRNNARLIERPPGAQLSVPAGFKVEEFAGGFDGPRRMLVAANGDVLVSEVRGGRIAIMKPAAGNVRAASSSVYVEGLRQPFGLAFYPNAAQPQWLYVAETHRIVRYPYRTGDQRPRGQPEVMVELPSGRGHYTRDMAFSRDGKRMYVTVGSMSNFAETMPKKTAAEIETWEAEHGLGATWEQETHRAMVRVYNVEGDKVGKTFATGLRNCVSLIMQPNTDNLWCTVNERDVLGDDLVPDYSTRVREGGFYGWPWYYLGNHEEPRLKGERPDLAGKVITPDVLYQAHSAALHLEFYGATSGSSAFPAEYVGDAFVALHGSWNRSFRTGYKLVRVRMSNGVPTGEYQDFLTGFIVDDGNVWGRPVATTILQDGSMLMSDDAGNRIFRISYAR